MLRVRRVVEGGRRCTSRRVSILKSSDRERRKSGRVRELHGSSQQHYLVRAELGPSCVSVCTRNSLDQSTTAGNSRWGLASCDRLR